MKPNETKLISNQTSDLLENKKRIRKEDEDEKNVKCITRLRLNIFNTYWIILKRNYQDKQHTQEDFKYYYSIFREYEEKDFITAIKMVLKYQSYFPRIDEIVKYLPQLENENVPTWFNKTLEVEETSSEEKQELEKIIQELEG